ncbi:unnamed protein product, partial [Didymodactylos carnosus]
IITDALTIIRLTNESSEDDTTYGILLIVHSIFLTIFLITGILCQRLLDIIAFFLSAILLTTYVVIHFFKRRSVKDQYNIRLARLIFTIFFNACFIPLTMFVIRDYRRNEYAKRLFGAFQGARRPLQIYYSFACVIRISAMLTISTLILDMRGINKTLDTIILAIGIPLVLIWLGIAVLMVQLENIKLAIVFYLLSLFQPVHVGWQIYEAITEYKNLNPKPSPSPATSTSSMRPPLLQSTSNPQKTDLIPLLTVFSIILKRF